MSVSATTTHPPHCITSGIMRLGTKQKTSSDPLSVLLHVTRSHYNRVSDYNKYLATCVHSHRHCANRILKHNVYVIMNIQCIQATVRTTQALEHAGTDAPDTVGVREARYSNTYLRWNYMVCNFI